ncbi:tol protein-like protein [Colletotrichum asianum]|uniref:Tol protein-like protein n=1 Tax=Colletotrichum asianum TaxID=702518 RepID=A0A8H3VXS5_9PEZI|nr:tol protein-like protein [Colletotrichum asianum]
MASVTQLCDYCSLIDFSYLHNPTAAEIDSLNAGERPSEDRFPLKFGQPIDGDPSWTLGRADRIRASADTCVFCKAVKEVLIQYEDELTKLEAVGLKDPLCYATCDIAGALQPPKGTAWEGAQPGEANLEFIMRRLAIYFIPFDENTKNGLNPGRVGFKEASWKRIFHCFQTYDAARSQDSFNVKTFFGGPHNPGDILFAGRKRPSKVDMRLPIQWLKHCKENHAASCGFARAEDRDEDQDGGQGIAGGSRHPVPGHMPGYMPVFRLIDVETMAIVERTDVLLKDLNYLTLSYVWGKTPQKEMLFEANRNKLRKDNSLKGRLSRTIEDACTFTKGMGTQYLWVDALCIVQDSDADKAVQIGKMADIYANALLNIIAASGKDSHAGLPGISTDRNRVQKEITIRTSTSEEGISLLSTLSHTSSRFSNFTSDTTWFSRGWTLQERAVSRRSITFLDEQITWACCESHWSEETNSEASAIVSWFNLSGSVLSQFGIQRPAKEISGEQFLWGLPTSRFELGLCWEPNLEGVRRRSALTTLPTTSLKKKVPFPSWSWIGWKGPIGLTIEDRHVEAGLDPVISCYILRREPLRLVQVRLLFLDNPQNPPVARGSSAVSLDVVKDHYPALTTEILDKTPEDQILFFWADSARFRVTEPIKSDLWQPGWNPLERNQHAYYVQHIIDSDGKKVGETGRCKENFAAGASKSGGYEFVVIAENTAPPDFEKKRVALQVARRPDGVAYRINIAEISQVGWENATVTHGLIALGSEEGVA